MFTRGARQAEVDRKLVGDAKGAVAPRPYIGGGKKCVDFDNHKQEVFNLVQALRALFLYTQNAKDMVEEYGRNLKSPWDTVEVFGGSPGVHKGLTNTILKGAVPAGEVATAAQVMAAEEELNEKVKAALLISGADR